MDSGRPLDLKTEVREYATRVGAWRKSQVVSNSNSIVIDDKPRIED
jgi:hypothetical protein